MDQHATDTIAAIATAPGRAGIAVVRLSGDKVGAALEALGISPFPSPRKAVYTKLLHPASRSLIDHGLVLWFPGPNSFTGEDVAELQVHGSGAVLSALMEALTALPGIRLAEPGEFARRAFFHDKMDLLQAEGLADLIDAETEAQREQALRILEGDASEPYGKLRDRAANALAHLEAYIDFPDEDIPASLQAQIIAELEALLQDITGLVERPPVAQRIRDGVILAIIGAPNAGKSSLLNALARRDAAIVSPEAGTTRDKVEVLLQVKGYAVTLIDTAGLRKSNHEIELEGIRRARQQAEQADIILPVFDGTAQPDPETLALVDARSIVIMNKADSADFTPAPLPVPTLHLSAKTGQGLDALEQAIADKVLAYMEQGLRETPLITRARHREALVQAMLHVKQSCTPLPLELQCEELRRAAVCIGRITGRIAVDEVLDRIFSEFCIGK